MKHLDLFSGIGGFSLAADWVWDDVEHTFCEIEPFCVKVLNKHWPDSKIYGDIKELKGNELGAVTLVTGGFPCQPFSNAGKRKGKDDDRDLWPEMFRIIKETNPDWIVGENVAGFVGMELDRSISDLEDAGYEVRTFVIPACAVGAPHRRDRVWIVAHNDEKRKLGERFEVVPAEREQQALSQPHGSSSETPANDNGKRGKRVKQKEIQGKPRLSRHEDVRGSTDFWGRSELFAPKLCGNGNGVSARLDALGNAIVPQVAVEIFKAIKEIDV